MIKIPSKKIGYTISFFIALVIFTVLWKKGMHSVSGDESGRILWASYLNIHNLIKAEVWLPFYKIVVGVPVILFNNLFVPPKITTFIFGILTIYILGEITNTLFNNKAVFFWTLLFAVFFPDRVILSQVPLSEIYFIFLELVFFYFLLNFFSKKESKYLYIASLFVTLGAAIRYEGWIIVFSFCLLLFYIALIKKEIATKTFILTIFICSLFPIYWIVLNKVQTGSFLSFVTASAGRYKYLYGSNIYKYIHDSMIAQFLKSNIHTLNILGVFGLIVFYKSNKKIVFSIFPFALSFFILSCLSIIGIALPSHTFWRIASLYNIFLIPFTSYFICDFLYNYLKNNKLPNLGKIISNSVLVIILILFIFNTHKLSKKHDFNKYDYSMGQYVKTLNLKNTKILIESKTRKYNHIKIASNLPLKFITNSGYDPKKGDIGIINTYKPVSIKYLKKRKIKYLLFYSKDIVSVLDNDKRFKKLKQIKYWNLYEVTDQIQHKNENKKLFDIFISKIWKLNEGPWTGFLFPTQSKKVKTIWKNKFSNQIIEDTLTIYELNKTTIKLKRESLNGFYIGKFVNGKFDKITGIRTWCGQNKEFEAYSEPFF